MNTPYFKVGDFVKYSAVNGSIGKIIIVKPGENDNYYYTVQWVYGLDAKGKLIKDTSWYLKEHELMPISEELYNKVASNRAWCSKQEEIKESPLEEWVEKNAADLESAIRGHPSPP